jgi:putative chitinase
MITLDDLKAICQKTKIDRLSLLVDPLNAAMREFDINTVTRETCFLAQIAHESGGFNYLRELWGPTPQQTRYEGRLDLGNTEPGDGFKYRGRGLIQVTGRANYKRCGEALDLPLEDCPEMLELPLNACRSAGWFWKANGCNEIADSGDFVRLTRRINGGTNGLADRQAYLQRATEVLA